MLSLELKSQLGELAIELKLQLPAVGITAIFGRSGAGKTSLINFIAGITQPDQGTISLNQRYLTDTNSGLYLPPEKRGIGYVFQDAQLFPHYTVAGNLNYGRRKQRQASMSADSIINLLGLEPLLNRYPATLSGGEKQRVAIGRALLTDPDILLMDEPLASLDLPRKQELIRYLNQLSEKIQIPILYVSHSLQEVAQLADQLLVLEQGKLAAFGPVEEVWQSEAIFPWLQGDSRSSLFKASLEKHHTDYAMSCLKLDDRHSLWVRRIDAEPGTKLRLKVRANEVSLIREYPQQSSIRNILPVEVGEIRFAANDQAEVKLLCGDTTLWSHITRWASDDLNLKVGDQLYAQIKGVSITQDDWTGVHNIRPDKSYSS